MNKLGSQKYSQLIENIGNALMQGRNAALRAVNRILLETYWEIGKNIVDYEQRGSEKAEYGSRLLTRLSKDLKQRFGKGFSKSNVYLMRQFYLKYPKFQTLSGKLNWSIYSELLSVSDDLARSFYERQCIEENWSVRELKRQINSGLFERLALGKNKSEILELAKQGVKINFPKDIVKDPYVFEFLGFTENMQFSEKDLENQLVEKLTQFLLELGKGFAYVGRQFRITLNNTHFYVDLVFYHRLLKCFVLIDLKLGKVDHKDIGQMNLYLNYFKAEENGENDADPIGIILAADKDEILVEYALGGLSNHLFISKYQLFLPDKEQLRNELQTLLEKANNRIND